MIPVLLGVSLVTFVTARLLPGNPAILAAGPMASPKQIAELEIKMGLDKPVWEQYYLYLRDLLHGDLGTSWRTGKPVTWELWTRFPATFELITTAMMIAVLLGIPLGVLAAIKQNTFIDHVVRVYSVAGVSIPVFWSGLVLIFIFYYLLGWAPPPIGRIGISATPPDHITGLYILDSILTLNGSALAATLAQMALPLATLVFAMMSPITRITRSSMLEVLRDDYIRTAWASGLPKIVVYRDAVRNALFPVLTMAGIQYGYSLGGEVLVEQIFSWPGMGRYSVDAIFNLDYAPVQAFVMYVAALYMIIYLVIDVLFAILDPRIRY